MAVPAALPFSAIVVATDDLGRLRAVNSVRGAAQMLVADWPAEKRGNAYRNACEATYQALSGKGDVEAARQAFIFAAKAAGIFVREGDRGVMCYATPVAASLWQRFSRRSLRLEAEREQRTNSTLHSAAYVGPRLVGVSSAPGVLVRISRPSAHHQ